MKQKILFTLAGLLLVTLSFAAGSPDKALPGQTMLPGTLSPYPKLPFKEMIFAPRQFLTFDTPAIVELPDGGLFAAWCRSLCWGYNGSLWGSRRPVGAKAWTEPSLIHDISRMNDKNPVLYIDRDKNLRVVWALQQNKSKWNHKDIMQVKVSKDSGRTWGNSSDFGTPVGYLSRSRPIRLYNGWLVMPIYMDWDTSSFIIISKDGGLTWGKPKLIFPFLGIEPTIIQRSDLSLFALMRSGTWPRRSWEVTSEDLGRSWKNWRISDITNPGSALEMMKLRNGHVVLVFNNAKRKRYNLSIALSYDDGKTWPHIKSIEDQRGHVYDYPSIIQDRYGLIHVVYCYDDQNIAHFVTNEEWIEN
jgi:predicted neuraminidase